MSKRLQRFVASAIGLAVHLAIYRALQNPTVSLVIAGVLIVGAVHWEPKAPTQVSQQESKS